RTRARQRRGTKGANRAQRRRKVRGNVFSSPKLPPSILALASTRLAGWRLGEIIALLNYDDIESDVWILTIFDSVNPQHRFVWRPPANDTATHWLSPVFRMLLNQLT